MAERARPRAVGAFALCAAAVSCFWGIWGAHGALLSVFPGNNASCPWRIVVLDEQQQPPGRLELCTRVLPVAFQGSPAQGEFTEGQSHVFHQTPTSPSPSSSSLGTSEVDPLPVPDGYTRLAGGGVYKVHEEVATWLAARAACEAEGAHLVVLNSKKEASVLKAHLESKRHLRPPFTLHAGFNMEFATSSGRRLSSLKYERWAPLEPAAPLCGRIDHDAWLLFGPCAQPQRFVCEIHNATLPTHRLAFQSAPPEHQVVGDVITAVYQGYREAPHGSSVYYKWNRFTSQNFHGNPWADAKLSCAAERAQLAVIESEEEAEAIVDFFQDLPEDEPYGETLVGLGTAQPVTVLGDLLSASGYTRWAQKGFPESCLCIDIKVMFHTCPCENPSLSFLCKMVSKVDVLFF